MIKRLFPFFLLLTGFFVTLKDADAGTKYAMLCALNTGSVSATFPPALIDTTDLGKLTERLILMEAERHGMDYVEAEPITKQMGQLCPAYFELRSVQKEQMSQKFFGKMDQLKLVERSPDPNRELIRSLINEEDNTFPLFRKPLSPVFHQDPDSDGVITSDKETAAEKELFRIGLEETGQEVMGFGFIQGRYNVGLPNRRRISYDSVYVFSERRSYLSSIKEFIGISMDTGSRFIYILEEVSNEPVLIASRFDLDLEYGNHAAVDAAIDNYYPGICNDCPRSERYQKSFAKLKGFDHFYFTYTYNEGEPEQPGSGYQSFKKEGNDQVATPIRSLIYYDGEIFFEVWKDEIDKFGCSSL